MKDYKNNFLYRLVIVAYVLAFLFLGFIVALAGFEQRPQQFVDGDKSYIECWNGNKHSLNSVNIYIFDSEDEISGAQNEKARLACPNFVMVDPLRPVTSRWETTPGDYTLHVVNSIKGSWGSAVIWWLVGMFIVYLVLNLIREGFLYLFFGKKLFWDSLTKLPS